mmetsp:Transcript_84564/g.148315  ORF Transcript_84564/g.148315 Transcript_84564/m.148315 type:complete len:99 (-) Transcript_84564:22-318(-)
MAAAFQQLTVKNAVKAEVEANDAQHAYAMKTRTSVEVKAEVKEIVAKPASPPPPSKEEAVKSIQNAYKELKPTKQQSRMILGRRCVYPVEAQKCVYSQ